jgi:O-methyltransferase
MMGLKKRTVTTSTVSKPTTTTGLNMHASLKKAARHLFPSSLYNALDGGLSILRQATFKADGMATVHNADFLHEQKFQTSFQKGLEGIPTELVASALGAMRWRAHICCWAAGQAAHLEGDFVECGVWYGVLSKTLAEYVDFDKLQKTLYLLDPWGNINQADRQAYEPDIYDAVARRFSNIENVRLVRGFVPDTLTQVPSEKVAYLSIDMNAVEPERHALEYFYPKMVKGGVIYFDDYGWAGHKELKAMIDDFFRDKPESILYMPTGQGIIVKL